MITVTLSQDEVRERSQALAQYANKMIELEEEEEDVKAAHKSKMARLKERRLEISGEIRRLSRAVRLGVEERTTQRVLFDEEKRMEEFRRECGACEGNGMTDREIERAEELIEKGEELIEQQQAKAEQEAERERLHKEAVANWRRERPASAEGRKCKCGDYEEDHAESGGCMLAACDCTEFRPAETEEEGEGIYVCQGCGAEVETDLSATDGLCSRCWTPDAIKDPEERAAFIAENSDDFTAPICDECKRIDGGHTAECSHSNALRFDDYLAYARAHYKSNHQSHARKMELTKLKDEEVREWKQQQAGNGAEPAAQLMPAGTLKEVEKKPKKAKSAKLSPVEAAIDR